MYGYRDIAYYFKENLKKDKTPVPSMNQVP